MGGRKRTDRSGQGRRQAGDGPRRGPDPDHGRGARGVVGQDHVGVSREEDDGQTKGRDRTLNLPDTNPPYEEGMDDGSGDEKLPLPSRTREAIGLMPESHDAARRRPQSESAPAPAHRASSTGSASGGAYRRQSRNVGEVARTGKRRDQGEIVDEGKRVIVACACGSTRALQESPPRKNARSFALQCRAQSLSSDGGRSTLLRGRGTRTGSRLS